MNENLENQVAELKQKIEELEKGRRPVLPHKVADALEKAKKDHGRNDLDYIAWKIAQSPDLDDYAYDSEHMKVLREWADSKSLLDLVDALRYGYTVEPPKEFTVNKTLNAVEIERIRECYKVDDQSGRNAFNLLLDIFGASELIADLREEDCSDG